MPRHLKYAGNRGAVLLILGVLWILTAVGIATTPIPSVGRLLPYEYLPVWTRVILWAFPGLFAVAAVVRREWDPAAWMLLIVPVAERAIGFAFATVTDMFSGGYPSAWRGFLVYCATGTLIYFCARGLDQPGASDSWGDR